MNVVVRNVEEAAFRKLKAKAVEEGLSVGKAINQAIYAWLGKLEKPNARKRPALLGFKPIRCGPGNENVSQEIDRIVYGVEL